MEVFGAPKHPQMLFLGFEPGNPTVQELGQLAARWQMINLKDLADLRVADWDVIVVEGTIDWARFDAGAHLFALSLGAPTGSIRPATGGYLKAGYHRSTASYEMHMTDAVPPTVARLIRQHLVPLLLESERRPFLRTEEAWNAGLQDVAQHDYLREVDGAPIVGHYPRDQSDDAGPGWVLELPIVPSHLDLWLAAAIELWRPLAPERFPEREAWRDVPDFMTSRQLAAHQGLETLAAEQTQAEEEFARRATELSTEAADAMAEAEAGALRLLTEDGDELVDAVVDALQVMGFVVVDADEELEPGTAKSEDLRITDPDVPEWTNITEIKGHTGGAKGSVLLKLSNWATRFALRNHEPPTTRWYIANQFRGTDPRTRQTVLRGAEDDLEVFGQDGGLVIDTRDLFEVQRRVLAKAMAPTDARLALREARGRFHLPENARHPGS